MLYLCIVIQKEKSHTDLTDLTDSFSLQATGILIWSQWKNSEGVKINTPFSKGAIKGMITDMVSCIKELTLQGIAVKIDDLAIFSIGIRNKEGAASEKEFTIAKNIDGFRLRARGTGEFSAKTINLAATLKKATALLGDGTTTDTNPDTGKDTTGGDNTSQGGSGTTGGDNTSQGGSGTTGDENVSL